MKTEPIHRTSMWKFKLSAATMTLIPAAVGINYVAKALAEGLKLPVWLGSLGTFLASMLADTVADEIAFDLINQGMAEGLIQKRVEEVATQMGLIEQLNLRPESLSGGQSQRLAIATAIAANPAVLIMDDPTSQMDPLGRRQFFQWLAQVKETTVFIVTSEIDDLCEVADVVWVLHEGQMVAQGRPGEVFNHLAADWQIPAPTIQQLAQKMDWHLADGRYPVNDADLKEVRYVHN